MKNKILIILFLLITVNCYAGDYVCFDSNGIIKEKYYSVDGSDLDKRNDCIKIKRKIFKKLTRWHKVVNGKIVEMSQTEKQNILSQELLKNKNNEIQKIINEDNNIASIDISSISLPKVDKIINNIQSLSDAKNFLKKLVRYIVKELK